MQVGVGGAFARDGGGRAVAGVDDRRVVHRQDHLAQRVLHVGHRAAGQVDAADRAGEQHVAAEQDRLVGVGEPEHDRALRVPRRVAHDEVEAGEADLLAVGQLAHVVGLGEGERAEQRRARRQVDAPTTGR